MSYYTKRAALPAWLTSLALLLSIVSGGRAQSSPALSGVVTDAFGALIPDAAITLYSPDRILQTKADQNGRFAFTNAPPGKYEVEASRAGFKTKTIEVVQIGDNPAESLTIALDVANSGDCSRQDSIAYEKKHAAGKGELGVKVQDSGRPLAKATVRLTGTNGTRAQFSLRTKEAGEFHFGNLETGQYELTVSHPGYSDVQTGIFWITRENHTTVVVQMLKQGLIRVCQ